MFTVLTSVMLVTFTAALAMWLNDHYELGGDIRDDVAKRSR
jgi:hypothetical protein